MENVGLTLTVQSPSHVTEDVVLTHVVSELPVVRMPFAQLCFISPGVSVRSAISVSLK